jgi:LacI family transcriptional regulator
MAKRISLADIAHSLGISKSTVSFVLNGKGKQFNIAEKTQQLILDKAKELNYVPNFFAKGLREGRTNTIGLVLADISNTFYSELTKVIQEELYALGYSLLIVSTNDEPTMELKLMRDLIMRSVDALIISPCNDTPQLKPLLDETPSIPVVWVDRIGDDFGDFIGIDNFREASNVINNFTNSPKKIALLKPDLSDVMTIRLRLKGAREACLKQGISVEEYAISDTNAVEVVESMQKNNVDAIIALNNQVALTCIGALNRSNWEFPEKVKLISFDDNIAFKYMKNPVSSLSQPVQLIGKETVERLLDRLKVATEGRVHLMKKCQFISRNTH